MFLWVDEIRNFRDQIPLASLHTPCISSSCNFPASSSNFSHSLPLVSCSTVVLPLNPCYHPQTLLTQCCNLIYPTDVYPSSPCITLPSLHHPPLPASLSLPCITLSSLHHPLFPVICMTTQVKEEYNRELHSLRGASQPRHGCACV